jgi:thymidylate synthase
VEAYLTLVRQVLGHGVHKADRTGTGTLSLFGLQARYDLRQGLPLVTTRKVSFEAVMRALLWF